MAAVGARSSNSKREGNTRTLLLRHATRALLKPIQRGGSASESIIFAGRAERRAAEKAIKFCGASMEAMTADAERVTKGLLKLFEKKRAKIFPYEMEEEGIITRHRLA